MQVSTRLVYASSLLASAVAVPEVLEVRISDHSSMVLEEVFTVSLSSPSAWVIPDTRDAVSSESYPVEPIDEASEYDHRVSLGLHGDREVAGNG